MFELLTRVLLWLLVITIVWYVFIRFIPRTYLTWLGGLIVFVFVVLAFFEPGSRVVSSVWSILSFPLKPLGLAIFLLLNSLKEGTKKVAGNQVVAALIILFLSSMPIVAYWLAGQAQGAIVDIRDERFRPAIIPAVPAIVVLGEGISPADPSFRSRVQVGNTETGFSNAITSRIFYAGELYTEQVANGNNPLVIISIGPQLNTPGVLNDQTAAIVVGEMALSAGIPIEKILLETEGNDLYTTAVEIVNALTARGISIGTEADILLVAPILNTSRAVSTFASLGVGAVTRPTDQFAFQLNGGQLVANIADLLPSVDALTLTTRVVEEYLTAVYYFLRGWLGNPLIV
jgi:uncharacterized SAM-binding protein YcdF (DUF218 family)